MRTAGDLTLDTQDFSTWRYAGAAPVLSFLAGGDIAVNGIVSDGFVDAFPYIELAADPGVERLLVRRRS